MPHSEGGNDKAIGLTRSLRITKHVADVSDERLVQRFRDEVAAQPAHRRAMDLPQYDRPGRLRRAAPGRRGQEGEELVDKLNSALRPGSGRLGGAGLRSRRGYAVDSGALPARACGMAQGLPQTRASLVSALRLAAQLSCTGLQTGLRPGRQGIDPSGCCNNLGHGTRRGPSFGRGYNLAARVIPVRTSSTGPRPSVALFLRPR